MLFTEEGRDTIQPLLCDRKILHPDMSVFLMVVMHMDWKTGKSRINQKALAAAMGMHEPDISKSVKRLQRYRLLARVREPRTGEAYFLINPAVASVGGPQRRGHLAQQFREAFGEE